LLTLAGEARVPAMMYALTQRFAPKVSIVNGHELTLPPILDMLGVRYVLVRGSPPPVVSPPLKGGDYFAFINHRALPRVFVPRAVQLVEDKATRLGKLAADDFNPRELALVETPALNGRAGRGEGRIVAETPNRVRVSANMDTGGLLVLGDAWNPGWHAMVNGVPSPVGCVNHYLRGVIVPPGLSTVEFYYRPRSVVGGLWLAGLGLGGVLGCVAWSARSRRSPP
jgi:hypothetical protein